MIIEPPTESRNQFVTLAFELYPIIEPLKTLAARINTLDQVKPIDRLKSNIGDPMSRVWECVTDYLISGLKVDFGADPEEEFEFFVNASVSELLYIYDEGPMYQNNRDLFIQETMPVLNHVCDGYILPHIRPVQDDLLKRGYVITAINGRFVEHANRLLLMLYLGERTPHVYGIVPDTEN